MTAYYKSSIISYGLLLCVLMPKINLINLPGFYQGIRYDDLFLLLGIIYILIQKKISFNILPGGKNYLIFYGFIAINGIVSSFMYGYVSFLIALRWTEYSIFFMLLYYSSLSHKNIKYFIIYYIILNSVVSALQNYGYIGAIYSFGYVSAGDPYVMVRSPGITGGSWEIPAIMSLFIIPIVADKSLRLVNKLFLIILSTIPVYYSGTRTGMVVFFVTILLSFVTYYRIRLYNVIFLAGIGMLFMSQGRMSFIAKLEPTYSMKIRFDGWYEKFIDMDYINYIIGKGLGYSGKVVDGMIARIFIDFGIFGLALYTIYYYGFLRKYKIILLILLLYSISIDVFSSSKIMFTLFMTVYYLNIIENSQNRIVYK